jgi:hypothetical protein
MSRKNFVAGARWTTIGARDKERANIILLRLDGGLTVRRLRGPPFRQRF